MLVCTYLQFVFCLVTTETLTIVWFSLESYSPHSCFRLVAHLSATMWQESWETLGHFFALSSN
jgi:hypothetical protein